MMPDSAAYAMALATVVKGSDKEIVVLAVAGIAIIIAVVWLSLKMGRADGHCTQLWFRQEAGAGRPGSPGRTAARRRRRRGR